MPADQKEWAQRLSRRAAKERVPISGMLELTTSCNLKCVHCYLGPQEEQRKKRGLEMKTERIKEVIDEIAAAGCLYLVITGGDPMVRKDFPEVYAHAKQHGLIVTVFCDGVLISESIVELFRQLPPYNVDISIYGATQETYEKVTRVPGSFPRFLEGVDRLHRGGVPFSLKTVMLSINRHEVEEMRQLAARYGVGFRIDSAVFPCLPTHDHEPLDLRVDPREAAEIELSDTKRLSDWIEYAESRRGKKLDEQSLYQCGAGVTNFYIDPLGYASPCLMTTNHRYALGERSFDSLWNRELVQLRSKSPENSEYTCNTCEIKVACTGCPAFNHLENGNEDVKSQYVCETTQHRWSYMQEAVRLGDTAAVARRLARRRAAENELRKRSDVRGSGETKRHRTKPI